MIYIPFKTAFRNLLKNKKFSALNLFGPAIGIAACLIILLYVRYELSFDRFNVKADQIVRVVFRGNVRGQKIREANVMAPVAKTLKESFPEVLQATRLVKSSSSIIAYQNKSFKENAIAFVDPNFFQVFTLPFLEGNKKTALLQPNTIVITRTMAEKYFGTEEPLGKLLRFSNQKTSFRVTGEIDQVPANSHFHFDFFASMESLPDSRSNSFMESGYYTYLVLPKGYDYKKLQDKLPGIVNKYIGPQMQQAMGMTIYQFRKNGNNIGLYLQPLTDIHLHSNFTNGLEPGGDYRDVYIFGIIAAFILFIACINYVNLCTAGASGRAREVGLRKVLGCSKTGLIGQFMLESFLVTAIALLLAIGIVILVFPYFNELSGANILISQSSYPQIIFGLLLLLILTAILGGSYPAFYLSSFQPVTVLKGRSSSGHGGMGIRSGLVVFQFLISIILIISTIVVYKQLVFMREINLGYDKNQVMVLPETGWLGKNQEAFRQQLLRDPLVENVSASGFLPAGSSYMDVFYVYPDHQNTHLVKTLRYDVDENYLPTMGMHLAAGRNFSRAFGTDSSAIIINETAARAFGWGNKALGHIINCRKNDGTMLTYHVIGMVRDFHFNSLRELISPLVMVLGSNSGTTIVKVKTSHIAALLTRMKKQWESFDPPVPLTYSFLNERVYDTYLSEQKAGTLLGIFSGLAIFIACLGLFGLTTYAAEQRTKEIGIRKVLGAKVSDIVSVLSGDFLKLVLISIPLAWPIAWWSMNKWLQNYAYRTEISWWIFPVAGITLALISLITICFQAIKAAIANPIKNLRTE